jgi:amidase
MGHASAGARATSPALRRRDFLAAAAIVAAGMTMTPLVRAFGAPPPGFNVEEITIAELQAAMQAGRLSAESLVDIYIRRIQAIDRSGPGLRSVQELNPDALAIAKALDDERRFKGVRGPMHGIPVLLKDNIATADKMETTAGALALVGARPREDSFVAKKLRDAGAVILGKASMSEWAYFKSTPGVSGWSARNGQGKNPYALDRTPCGSSSGSAIAVAANLVAVAVGTETDGSIVSPAAACGVVGIKPTVGLVSRSGIVPISAEQDTAGPMARTVADAAALLTALAGQDAADPATAEAVAHATDYAAFLDPGALAGARLGVWRAGSDPAGPATVAVLDAAIARLRACGAEVIDPVDLPDADKIAEPEYVALRHEFKHDINAYLAALDGDHPRTLKQLIEYNAANAAAVLAHFGQDIFEASEATSGDLADADYLSARADARRLARGALDAAMVTSRLDAVISLTGSPAWLTDHTLGDHHTFGTSSPAAVAGYPAITVPAGQVDGLPVGISMAGPAWSEPRLIALAHSFEQASPAAR